MKRKRYKVLVIHELELNSLIAILDFTAHPAKYGGRIDIGDARTYKKRIGKTVAAAEMAKYAIEDRAELPSPMTAAEAREWTAASGRMVA